MKCPVSSAERRLEDAASFWQRAREAYFDPDEFRRTVQSSIQAFRTVTWLLQKERDSIASFADWYTKKQDEMRGDKRLRWLVEARNKIEKQGDLETYSTFTVEHTDSWLPPEKRMLELPPGTRPEDTAKIIAATYPESKCGEGAILKLSREWVDSEMPTQEILNLLVHAYSVLQAVILDAHRLLGQGLRESCPFYAALRKSTSRLPEGMTAFQFPAVSWFSLEHGVLKEYDHKRKTLTRAEIEKTVEERYDSFGGMDSRVPARNSPQDAETMAEELRANGAIVENYYRVLGSSSPPHSSPVRLGGYIAAGVLVAAGGILILKAASFPSNQHSQNRNQEAESGPGE